MTADQRLLRQCAVPDLPPACRAHPFDFAGGIRREIVMVHEALGIFQAQVIHRLALSQRTQGGYGQHLCLPARE